ncbi:MAG: hypothetical protein ACQEP1_00635 [Nanobdellota archaeon]
MDGKEFRRHLHGLRGTIGQMYEYLREKPGINQEDIERIRDIASFVREYHDRFKQGENLEGSEHKDFEKKVREVPVILEKNGIKQIAEMMYKDIGDIFSHDNSEDYTPVSDISDKAEYLGDKAFARTEIRGSDKYTNMNNSDISTVMNNLESNLRKYGKDISIKAHEVQDPYDDQDIYRIKVRNKKKENPAADSTKSGNIDTKEIMEKYGGEVKFKEGKDYYVTILKFPVGNYSKF